MIYFCMAFYQEAKPFIQMLSLKKVTDETRFQVFQADGIRLLITGIGEIASASAVSHLLTSCPPGEEDFFVNAGICASLHTEPQVGTCFLCTKLMEQHTGRTFYPDLLLRHPFQEASLMTCPAQVADRGGAADLADMEAAGIYQAAGVYLRPHQMAFLKVVSDWADGTVVRAEQVQKIMEANAVQIVQWSKTAQKQLKLQRPTAFSPEEIHAMDSIAHRLHMSLTMRRKLEALARYHKLEGRDVRALLEQTPVAETEKEGGKRYLEQLSNI